MMARYARLGFEFHRIPEVTTSRRKAAEPQHSRGCRVPMGRD